MPALLCISNVFMTFAWRQLVGFGFVALGGFFVFQKT